jgi:biotin-(acetyl-CoA carboxylase) ligase
VENVWSGNQLQGSVLGIGVNLRPGAAPPDCQLDLPAIDLESSLGYRVDAVAFLLALLQALADWWGRLGTPAFLQVWNERLAYRGQNVIVGEAGDQLHGRLEAVNSDGHLVLRGEDGSRWVVRVGDVHLRPQEEDFQTG